MALFFIMPMISHAQSVDPTKPIGLSGSSTALEKLKGKLVLETIVHGEEIHTAIINGKVLKVGEFVGEYKLVAVNDRSVILRSELEKLKLTLFPDVIVKK